MNKTALLIFYALLSLNSFAQNGFQLGADGSVNSTFIWRQNNYGTLAPFQIPIVRQSEMNYKFALGGTAGVVAGYNFSKHWGIEAGALYATAGQKYEDNFEGPATIPEGTFGSAGGRVNVKRDVRLDYVQIPVMAKFTTKIGKKIKIAKFYACLGPQFGARTSAYEQVKIANYVYLPDSLNFTSDQKFQHFDFGLAVRAGFDIYATHHLFFEVGIMGYAGIFDINGQALQQLGWYDKNHVSYQKSHNASAGLALGVHYLFFKKGAEGPIQEPL